ncbi:HupE/UreJ family protein [Leptothoe spongobia]|uniref:HupE/UreJ family protein n=1 Tax=Leptothoe spongobia TAU-MAC 1115 TaxID=1967444 RepID=A0A947DKL4_9CYAN|nr:HupE/UreJ family protein [Leptothoe spongobia]MBT9317850.1 HupE/UreJ family protein [Leptothoe spongobia TAU-MAC 1115]
MTASVHFVGRILLGLLVLMGMLSLAAPAFAHHPLGGRLPANAFEGLMSGMGHPIIGLDHLAFVIAAGLIAATRPKGVVIPIMFVLASMAGTVIHLMSFDLPAPELVVSASVLAFGVILAMGDRLSLLTVALLATAAGIFHGFAYGEGIFGAEPTPMVAYLIGFTAIQMVIALLFSAIGSNVIKRSTALPPLNLLNLRFAGFTLAGIGLAFLSSAVLG